MCNLAIFTVQEIFHCTFAGFVELAIRFAVGLSLSRRGFRFAAIGAAVGETGLVRLELEFFSADGAGSDGESHRIFMIRR
jgi:hypothetical protein